MKSRILKCGCLMLVFSFCGSSNAGELYDFYNGIRQMGMGGAAIATVNDETALLANPAGLGKLRDNFTTVIDPEIDYGATDSTVAPGTAILNTTSLQGVLNALNQAKDIRFHLRAQVFPSLVLSNFGIGFYEKIAIDGIVNSVSNTFPLDYRNDTVFAVGYCFRFWDGRIKFGFNGKYINRVEINHVDTVIAPTVTNLDAKTYGREGGAISSDIGLILSAPWVLLPTLAVVYHDVGDTEFSAGNGIVYGVSTLRPRKITGTVDAAIAIFPIIGNRTRTTITVEYRDITNKLTEDTGAPIVDTNKKIHAGAEINVHDMFFVRAGMNQHYWTAGLEFAYDRFQFQLASYGEDVGIGTANVEDRRYSVKFAYRF